MVCTTETPRLTRILGPENIVLGEISMLVDFGTTLCKEQKNLAGARIRTNYSVVYAKSTLDETT